MYYVPYIYIISYVSRITPNSYKPEPLLRTPLTFLLLLTYLSLSTLYEKDRLINFGFTSYLAKLSA